MIGVTPAMVTAYQDAWHDTPEGGPISTRAGLQAMLAMLEDEFPPARLTTTLEVEPDPMGIRAEALRLAAIVCQPVAGSNGNGSSRMPAGLVLDMAEAFGAWILTGERQS